MRDGALMEVPVLGSVMAYREAGAGRPVLLLHGNPTSSFLWRHLLRRAASGDNGGHRWIAVDLIGMGASGNPDLGYRLVDHIAFVDAFIDVLGLSELVLVGHDWGVAIAMDRLRRRPADVRALAMMEGHIRPLPNWDAFDEGGRQLFQNLRAPVTGDKLVLADNFFMDTLLPSALLHPLAADELAIYQAPYQQPEARTPLLQWAREIPIAGQPADVAALMTASAANLTTSNTPTLLVHGEPGVLVTPDTVFWCRSYIPNLTVHNVGGPAGHFLPEDRAEQVADALLHWVTTLS